MKKSIVLLPLLSIALFGCNSPLTQSNKEVVTLTTENFSTYVATRTSFTEMSNSSYRVCSAYFEGADNCRFKDCTVTYVWSYGNTETLNSQQTISLTISGDGETKPVSLRYTSAVLLHVLGIVDVSGTVEVYKY